LLFPAPLRQRFIMVSVLAMGSLGGLLLPHPEHGQSPFLPLTLSMLFLTTLASTALGHYNYLIFRDNFRQAQELARNAAELEARVAEKTQDMRELLAHSENLLDKERARIARDLHDELGQELTAVRFAVALTQERFAQAPQSIEKNLLEIDHIVQRTSKTVRGLVSELRPLLLDDLGLHAAAQWLTSRIAQRTGLDCQLKIVGDSQELPPEVVTAAYRLMQEALTNVARHAQATQVQVTLHTRREQLDLRITDDGIGFDPALRSAGMGLLGMRERALALGTRLIIRSAPEAGTEIQCSLPLTAKGVVKFSSQPVVVESQT
jgi:signal transduction histidine kinase